jgi:hypothetical protein
MGQSSGEVQYEQSIGLGQAIATKLYREGRIYMSWKEKQEWGNWVREIQTS